METKKIESVTHPNHLDKSNRSDIIRANKITNHAYERFHLADAKFTDSQYKFTVVNLKTHK